jgi:hypothetical protein
MLIIFLYFFPDGRPVPRWMGVPAVAGSALIAIWDNIFFGWGGPFGGILMYILALGGVAAQVYRYRRASNRPQRQQTKWLVFGVVVGASAITLYSVVEVFVPAITRPGSLVYLFVTPLAYLSFIAIPLAIGFAILRYRLYDIDILINRTLVYSLLTGTLALLYWSTVVLLQGLFRPLFGQGNDLAIVVSTLVIAALFMPLRRRIQSFIDRRFYRRRYDAARTLAAFSGTVRDEVDLNRLTDRLVEAVEETMQPAHVSLWLREPERNA